MNKEYTEVNNDTTMSEDASPDKELDTKTTEGSEMATLDSDKDKKLVIKFKLMQGSERQVEITKK